MDLEAVRADSALRRALLNDHKHRAISRVVGAPRDAPQRTPVDAARQGVECRVHMPLPDVVFLGIGAVNDLIEVALQVSRIP